MKTKKVLALLMAMSMFVTSALVGNNTTAHAEEISKVTNGLTITEVKRTNKDLLNKKNTLAQDKLINKPEIAEDEMVRVIITFDGDSVIDADNDAELNWATESLSAKLERDQNYLVKRIERKVLEGASLDVHYQYTWLLNGIATEVPYGKIAEIEALAGVDKVLLQPQYEVSKTEVSNPNTISDGQMFGREDTWADGYTGTGMKICVIDTGIDEDHQNFGPLSEDKLTEDSETVDKIADVLTSLNAYERFNSTEENRNNNIELTADDLYRTTKIAYGFNYVDRELNITHDFDEQGDHGSHVSGIAAANKVEESEVVGVAPDAQIFTMKVFGKGGGAYTEDLLAAIEDALILDADIINMSLGSAAGFTTDGEEIDSIYSKVKLTDTVLCISAGNSSTAGENNLWGMNAYFTSDPDNSVVGSPAVYDSATSVASVENVSISSEYMSVGDFAFGYNEATSKYNAPLSTIQGEEYEIVPVPGFGGTVEEYVEAGVEGKVALISRGQETFATKIANAEAAGAVACIIYNNTSGTIGMDLSQAPFSTIPAASIKLSDAEKILALLEEDDSLKFVVGEGTYNFPSEDAYKMSTFSSWGVAPNLTLEPDIAAPGGNIYSTINDGKYGLMSGTSMACPNLSGMAALVKQYAKENYELSDAECHKFVNALLMSTSTPLMYDADVEFSPRQQGSGLANAFNAVTTEAYLSVEGQDVPKIDLFDDVERTGEYSFEFEVNNFGKRDLFYLTNTSTITEGVTEAKGLEFMANAPVALEAVSAETSTGTILAYDYDEDGEASVADARDLFMMVEDDTVDYDVAFRYDMNADEKVDRADVQSFLDALVGKESDADLEGEVIKVPAGESVTVAVSVVVTEEGKAYMDEHFENGIYVEGYTYLKPLNVRGVELSIPYLAFYGDWTSAPIIDFGYYWEDEDESMARQYNNALFSAIGQKSWEAGMNPYGDEEFDLSNIVISPNGDGVLDGIRDIYVSLLRNAGKVHFTFTDDATGDVYFDDFIEHARKSSYSQSKKVCLPLIYSWHEDEIGTYDFTGKDGNVLPDLTKLTLSIKAELDYDRHESNNTHDTWELPIVIDTTAPVILTDELDVYEEDGRFYLKLSFSDNYKAAGVAITDADQAVLLREFVCDKAEPDEVITQVFDITGLGSDICVFLGDYGCNETGVRLEVAGNSYDMVPNVFYGYRTDDASTEENEAGWVCVNKSNYNAGTLSTETDMAEIIAAEYVDEYIVAVDANNNLVVIVPGAWDERNVLGKLEKKVTALAYDPSNDYLFAQTEDGLGKLDLSTGAIEMLFDLGNLVGMCFDADGYLYAINAAGVLYQVDLFSGAGGVVFDFGSALRVEEFPAGQGLAYDDANSTLYWNCYYDGESIMITVNFETGEIGKSGDFIADNAHIYGLFMIHE